MRYVVLIVALTLAALQAGAQEKPAPEAAKPPAQEAMKPAPKPAPAAKKHSAKRNEDARRCLELEGNTAIIKCAEEYL
jgi:uncharacterized membrane protein